MINIKGDFPEIDYVHRIRMVIDSVLRKASPVQALQIGP